MDRDEILESVRNNLPEACELPEIPSFGDDIPLVENFMHHAGVSSRVITIDRSFSDFSYYFEGHNQLVDLTGGYAESGPDLDVLIIKGSVGVAENGAIWVEEINMGRRILPFATQHLAILLDAKQIVPNMHEAYEIINIRDTGFGVFIAGPSKTADIEQSLVVGAHGPRSLTIFLML